MSKNTVLALRRLFATGSVLVLLSGLGLPAATFTSQYLFNTPGEVPTFANTTFSPFTRIGVLPASEPGAFASVGWSTGTTLDPNEYVEFTLTPTAGFSLSMATMSFEVWNKNSSVGPNFGMVEILMGGDSRNLSFDISSTRTTVPVNIAGLSGGDGEAITFRFYAWDSRNKKQGELDFDNVILSGDVNPVPEPLNVALTIFGLCFAGTAVYGKFRSARTSRKKRPLIHSLP